MPLNNLKEGKIYVVSKKKSCYHIKTMREVWF